MLTVELHESRSAALRRVLLRRRALTIVLDGIFYFSLMGIPILFLRKLGLLPWEGRPVYAAALGSALLLSLFQHLRSLKNFKQELIAIDIRMDLKERLSTAHEYQHKPGTSPLERLLKQEAVDLLADLGKQSMLPRVWKRRHLGLAAAAVLLPVLYVVDPNLPVRHSADQDKDRLAPIGRKISQYVRQQKDGKNKPSDVPAVAQQLSDLAREIEKKTAGTEEAQEAVQRMLSDVEQEQSKILERLQSELKERETEDPQTAAALAAAGRGTAKAGVMEELTEKIREKYGDQIPESINNALADLDRNRRLEDFLHEAVQGLKSISGTGGKTGAQGKTEKETDLEDRADKPDPGRKKAGGQPPQIQGGKSTGNKTLSGDFPDQGGGPKEGRFGEGRPGKEPAAVAGRGKGPDEKSAPYALPGAKGRIFKDQGLAGQAESYNANVRSLTKISGAAVTEEQIIRSYQRELEEALQKEAIPASYRNSVKKYFLNIGLRKEEKENDSEQ